LIDLFGGEGAIFMRHFFKSLILGLVFIFLFGCYLPISAQEKDYTHVVVLSDPHLPGRNIPMKQKAIETINSWPDVDMVVGLGDICQDLGTAKEYDYAKKFLSQLKKPFYPIAGNHDYIYEDMKTTMGTRVKASSSVRNAKLERFKETFSLPGLHYSKREGPYLLIFLSIDDLSSNFLAEISGKTLEWLRSELNSNEGVPTIIFFHSPLKGTLKSRNKSAEDNNFVAQPYDKIRKIILENSQIFLWVSGHTHIAPTNVKFSHKVNIYENRVTNIHNCDMDGNSYLSDSDYETTKHDHIWTNSLFLYQEMVLVKTYDHQKGIWLEDLIREITPNK
jgi:Icc protein